MKLVPVIADDELAKNHNAFFCLFGCEPIHAGDIVSVWMPDDYDQNKVKAGLQ